MLLNTLIYRQLHDGTILVEHYEHDTYDGSDTLVNSQSLSDAESIEAFNNCVSTAEE